MGRILCKIGLHRWEFKDKHVIEDTGTITQTYARCRRGCWRYLTWFLVHYERRPW